MPNYNRVDVKEALRMVERENGGYFVRASAVTLSVRKALRDLLIAYDYDDSDMLGKISDVELVTLYAAARDDIQKGAKIAARIYNTALFRGETNTVPLTVWEDEYSKPENGAKYQLVSDARAQRKEIDADLRLLGDDIEQLQRNTTDTLLRLTESLPDAVHDHVAEALKGLAPTRVEIVTPDAPPVTLGLAHRKTPDLIRALNAGVNVYLHGPAGSGKTTGARKAADAFKVPFYFAAKVESEYMLLGFKDARGETVRTQFREAYEHGGVFLFDEMDASAPSAVVAMNAALANGICPFPDGTIARHPHFKCIGAGNTKLTGASRQYTGRNQMDAASIDRFAFIEWGYDDALEIEIASNKHWARYVQAVRAAILDRGLPHLVTPRATYDGCALIAGGFDIDAVADMTVWKGLDADTVAQIKSAVKVAPPKNAPEVITSIID